MNNETKHTAGNWTIDRPDYETINIVADKDFICEIPNYINEGDESEKRGKLAEANARLIAAAPELLQACQDTLRILELNPTYTNNYRINKLTALIQKAIHG